MESEFKKLVELGKEIGLFVVSDGNSEYIIGEKELIELKNTALSMKKAEKEAFEFVTKCGKTLLVCIV